MPIDRRVILIGSMGAGKSTIGKLLAKDLGWPYIDNDSEMVALTGLNTEELSRLPVGELHQFECSYLKDVSTRSAPFIAGVAASVVDYAENIEILNSLTSIYLRITLEEVMKRAGVEGIGRGNIKGDLKTVLRERFIHRDPIYRSVAKYVIDLGPDTESDAGKILSFLRN